MKSATKKLLIWIISGSAGVIVGNDEDESKSSCINLEVYNNGNTLTVRYYSVARGQYGSEQRQFTIDLSNIA